MKWYWIVLIIIGAVQVCNEIRDVRNEVRRLREFFECFERKGRRGAE